MAREVYTDERFIRFSSRFVFMRVLVLDSRGEEIDRIEGALSAEQLIEELGFILEHASGGMMVNRLR